MRTIYKYNFIMSNGSEINIIDNHDLTKIIDNKTKMLKFDNTIINMDYVVQIICKKRSY